MLNDVIDMASKLIEKHGAHMPFAMVVTSSGERVNVAPDDSEIRDPQILFDLVRDEVKAGARDGSFRAIAIARNIEYVSAETMAKTDAIQITLDHVEDSAVTCYLPYAQVASGDYLPGTLFATDPDDTFF